jgi:hypothetical protein
MIQKGLENTGDRITLAVFERTLKYQSKGKRG